MKTDDVNIQLERRFVETKLSDVDVIRKRLQVAAAAKAAQAAVAKAKAAAIEEAKAKAVQAAAAKAKAAAIEEAKAEADAKLKADEIRRAAVKVEIERRECERRETDKKFHLEPLIYVGIYHPRRSGQNPNFDEFSEQVLGLKDLPSEHRNKAVSRFIEALEPIVPVNCLILCIPSSDPANQDRGISNIAERLCSGGKRHNADGILYRTEQIQSAHSGGSRKISVHLETMRIKDPSLISGKNVVLLDDVTTSGNSLRAAGRKLHECGARSITPVVIGRTYYGL